MDFIINYYLEKLNGTDDSTQKKVMEMTINCLIIVLVSGSVFFSAPTICERLLKFHLWIRNEIFKTLDKGNGTNATKPELDRDILFGIEFGIIFELIIITIVLLAIGIPKQKKEIAMVAIVFILITFSFIMSVTNSNSIGILKQYKLADEWSFSAHVLVYSIFPIPIAQMVVAVYYYLTGAMPKLAEMMPKGMSSIMSGSTKEAVAVPVATTKPKSDSNPKNVVSAITDMIPGASGSKNPLSNLSQFLG